MYFVTSIIFCLIFSIFTMIKLFYYKEMLILSVKRMSVLSPMCPPQKRNTFGVDTSTSGSTTPSMRSWKQVIWNVLARFTEQLLTYCPTRGSHSPNFGFYMPSLRSDKRMSEQLVARLAVRLVNVLRLSCFADILTWRFSWESSPGAEPCMKSF